MISIGTIESALTTPDIGETINELAYSGSPATLSFSKLKTNGICSKF